MNQYSKYLSLKSVIENVLGLDSWYALKESNHLPTWKKQLQTVIKAIHTSILATVEIYDKNWLEQITEAVDLGKSNINKAPDIEEAISALAAALINISFLQIGLIPKRTSDSKKIRLKKENWRLNKYRTVIYLQTENQKESLFFDKQQDELGFQNQIKIWHEYRASKSKKSYSTWCCEKCLTLQSTGTVQS